jgi:hypothetical protein
MTTNGPNDTKEEHGGGQQPSSSDRADGGHSGEGAASAMAHMISRGEQQRHQSGDANGAAGSQHA